ncbi:E3 ubiquitin protein ligase DRIP2-like isoform X1 [Durio zibethinus]|uniref:E3 ubiquitin protein ligase DRIP2-like isoform X1 n=2 Tax=Durio zibethinus TaxID=66656 RepID=A0A6P5WSN3_DURZI|nr:E3 ubiquitin protein ligase DRIP2-like isoform X1 [Durio zibethinus]
MAGCHHHIVKVKRETLVSCMTCPLCNKLLKEATTISLCLHTFCRKCIYEKLSDEGMDCCPVCDIELGCLPVDKLRPDHNLQDIRAKIFPFKRRKISAPEIMPSTSPPAKRKERSLSSLVVSTPKVPMQSGLTGRRTKATARKRVAAFRGCNFSVEEPLKKEDFAEGHPSGSSSPDSLNKNSQSKRQDSSMVQPSSEHRHNEDTDDVEMMEGKADLWTPLNCLVEAANRKSSKLNSQGSAASKAEPHNGPDCHSSMPEMQADPKSPSVPDGKLCIPKTKSKEHGQNSKVQDEENGTNLITRPVKRRRLQAAAQKKAAASEEHAASARVMLDALGAKWNRKNSPIWFSLVACEDRIGHTSLPQISACYLRIKDGKMPVSFIQKYLVKKLDLTSEAEVEIMCRGQPVLPTLQLHNLVDLWFRTASTAKKVPAFVGSSAKDFVMVLSYCRKV